MNAIVVYDFLVLIPIYVTPYLAFMSLGWWIVTDGIMVNVEIIWLSVFLKASDFFMKETRLFGTVKFMKYWTTVRQICHWR